MHWGNAGQVAPLFGYVMPVFGVGEAGARSWLSVYLPNVGITNSAPFRAPPVQRCVTALYFV
jgi:hypothetical protein